MKQERLLNVVLAPHISEKATIRMEKNNEYVFCIDKAANKAEVKDAIEQLFNTKVKAVHIVNVKSKQKLFKGIEGKKKGWKKAYVTLFADQKIDIVGAQ
jgi:large subunit ribosomal protein L23